MTTNGQKQGLTTKNTKYTKIIRGESKNHEWTRMDTNGKRNIKPRKARKPRKSRGESKNHEWTRMAKGRGSQEAHEMA